MSWIERREHVRLNPGSMLEGARSALCVALQYHPLDGEGDLADAFQGVARYARGLDYHDVMIAGMKRIEERIREAFPGISTRCYVDTGPILERELAARAGLGAIGKNTMLLHPEMGSYFLLGEILLTLDLPAENPVSDLCGSCNLCLQACPTGALVEAYRLDSRLCLSYWTIEHRGVLPAEVSSLSDEWVFGCDACQEVCPWNAATEEVHHSELQASEGKRSLGLIEWLLLERDRWVELFRGSPIKRAKLEGMQRNIASVLGHRAQSGDREALLEAMKSDYEQVRVEVVRALTRIGGAQLAHELESFLVAEASPQVRTEIERALSLC